MAHFGNYIIVCNILFWPYHLAVVVPSYFIFDIRKHWICFLGLLEKRRPIHMHILIQLIHTFVVIQILTLYHMDVPKRADSLLV